jgi:hypothetical protein
VPDLLSAIFAIHDGEPGRSLVRLRLHAITRRPVAADRFLQALQAGLPDLDAMIRSSVVEIELVDEPPAGQRKSDRIIDLRRYAVGRSLSWPVERIP